VFGFVLMFALGVYWLVAGAVSLTYRAGWAGTPGVVRSVVCFDVGSGRNTSLQCLGDFTSTDGRVVLHETEIEGDNDFSVLRTYPAALHADGSTVSVVGTKDVAYILCGMLFAVFVIELFGFIGVAVVVRAVRKRAGKPLQELKRTGRILMWTVGTTVVLGAAAGIVGAAAGS
jgi:hypothetical protein